MEDHQQSTPSKGILGRSLHESHLPCEQEGMDEVRVD